MNRRASLHESWVSEVRAAWLYRVLAEVETDERKQLFAALADDAMQQSRSWVKAIRDAGDGEPAPWRPDFRVRLVALLVRRLGPRSLLPALAALKVRGLSVYRAAPSTLEVLQARETGSGATGIEHHLRGEEQRHFYSRGVVALHAAIFGVNDGLVSNTALVLFVFGLTGDATVALLVGVGGLFAGAFSMAAGEFLAVRSRVELYERQIALEEEELRLYPDDEAEELALIFEARGLARGPALDLGKRLISEPARALDVLTREELGLNPDDLGSPWASGAASFLSFGAGALAPLLSFLALSGSAAPAGAAGLTLLALFVSGAATSLFTGRSALWCGLRLAGIGAFWTGALFALGRGLAGALGS